MLVVSKQLLTTEEAAKLIGVKQTTVRTWLNKGLLEGTKVGGGKLWRVREEAIEEFLSKKKTRPQNTKNIKPNKLNQ